jgi:peptidoglycan hydrolase CwlO-like protein
MGLFDILFNVKKKIKHLQNENEKLKQKLQEKQEHINKTNSYWKNKVFSKKL